MCAQGYSNRVHTQFDLRKKTKMLSRSLNTSLRYLSTLPNQTVKAKPYSEVPGPKSYPLIKGILGFSAPEVGSDPKENIIILKHLWKLYGDVFRIEIPGRPSVVFIFDPEVAEKMYRAAGTQPMRPGFDALRYVRENDPLTNQGSKGLLTSNKQDWYNFRSQVQQPMLRPKATLRYTPDLEAVVEEFIQKKIIAQRDKNSQMGPDFLDDMYKWALESVTLLALNARLGCLEPNLPENSDQMTIIRAVSDIFRTSAVLDNGAQLWRLLYSPTLNQFTEGYNVFKDLCYRHIRVALDDIKAKKDDDEGDPSILELLFARGCDENTAVVMAIDMIFAGIDTSSHTLAFLMYQLAKNPDVQEKLYQEIKGELPTKDSKLELKALDRMPYLRATIKEILRTNPPTLANARIIEEPIELGGYEFPGGLVYVPCHYFMGTSERFIDEPEKFIPERWLRNSPDKAKTHPFLMMPFGHGPRMCVGRRFAEQEVSIFITKILQNFRVEWHHEEMVMKVETLTKPFTPLRFTFIDR